MARLLLAAVVAALGMTPAPATQPAPRLVAFTFDDGPSSTVTPVVLDKLKANGVRATFCVVGTRGIAQPALVRRAVAEGHELCGHSWTHPHFTAHTGPTDGAFQTGEVLATWRNLIGWHDGWATGWRPTLWRYPYGQATGYADWWVQWSGMTKLRWDDQTISVDWSCPGASAIVQRIMAGVRDQSIILLHDGGDATVCGPGQLGAAVPILIDRLRAAGYTLGRVVPSATYSTVNQSFVAVVPW